MTSPPVHDSAMATLGIEFGIVISSHAAVIGKPVVVSRARRSGKWTSKHEGIRPSTPEKECVMQDPTQTKWEGRWDQLKGKARQLWGDLTDDDLDVAEGNYEEMIGRIKEKTGESAEQIRQRLEEDYADSEF
jgi:uncharacterized protein YjbJ (UPF0337 family)